MRKPLTVIVENPTDWLGAMVHVEGWNKACVFRLEATDGTQHVLVTPKTNRVFRTSNRLLHIRRTQEAMDAA